MSNYYWAKTLCEEFEAKSRWRNRHKRRTIKGAVEDAESKYAGYTSEPFIQMIEETPEQYRVIADWEPTEARWNPPDVPGGVTLKEKLVREGAFDPMPAAATNAMPTSKGPRSGVLSYDIFKTQFIMVGY
jgi:hypothetical protein